MDVQKLVPRNPNVFQFNVMNGDTVPTTWLDIVPRDNVTITDGKAMQTYSDFSTALGAIAVMAPDGDRTITVSFNAYLIPSGTAYTTAYDAYEDGALVAFRENARTRDGATTWTRTYTGFISQFNRTYNKDGVAEVSLSFGASSIVPVTP